jgi:GNAT superfamily N-acetyltransferase
MAVDIEMAAGPAIPGLRFRRFNPPDDYANIVSIFTASSEVDKLEYSETREDVERYYSSLANCDLGKDLVFVEVDGRAIGYSRLWFMVKGDAPGYIFQFFAALVPEWRGRGIREAMLSWCESRVREISSTMPAGASKDVILWVNEAETEWRDILKANGYEVVRYGFMMVRPNLDDIPDCPLPEGLEVRPVTPDEHRKIWDADVLASRDGWLDIDPEEEWYENYRSSKHFQPELWQVAWDGDRVAGAVQNYIDHEENALFGRKRGWTENIHVGREWRGKGVAKALIASSFKVLRDKGMTEAALGVDAMNPTGALHLYKKMGFVEHKKSFTFSKKLDEVNRA